MANLRKEARGRDCQVRIYGVCDGNPGALPDGWNLRNGNEACRPGRRMGL